MPGRRKRWHTYRYRPFTNSRLDWQRLSIWRHLRGFVLRDGTRDLLKPFNTRGITPAAGYTSTVEDLGRFASWAISASAHRADECAASPHAARDAACAVHGYGLEDELGTWFCN